MPRNPRLCEFLFLLVMLFLSVGGLGCATKAKPISESENLVTQLNGSQEEVVTLGDDERQKSEKDDNTLSQDLAYDPFATSEENIEEYDPWESYNVFAFEFNYRLDKYLIKPVAKVYNFFIPPDIQQSIFNAIQNIRVAPRLLNNVFQAKFKGAGIEVSRFVINTTLGIGGFFDPAKYVFNLETPLEDTGQTLGVYGAPPGPYVVIPFLGSFTVRDGIGYVGDLFLDPFNWLVFPVIEITGAPRLVTHDTTIALAQFGYRAGETINFRALNLERFQGVEEGVVDLYGAVRNAYLQKRAKAIKE